MNTHLPSFIISETPNGGLYGWGYLLAPAMGRGYSPARTTSRLLSVVACHGRRIDLFPSQT